jgi:hypothetical protein
MADATDQPPAKLPVGEPLEREERDALLPTARTLDDLRALATGCRACDLWARATVADRRQAAAWLAAKV